MKKSAIYYLAEIAVINSDLAVGQKLEVLRELMGAEELARFCEKEEEKEA